MCAFKILVLVAVLIIGRFFKIINYVADKGKKNLQNIVIALQLFEHSIYKPLETL